MSQPTIYHNPNCSKSRATLALLREQGFSPQVIAYLEQPPDAATLAELSRMLAQPVRAFTRSKEQRYSELNLADADEPTLIDAIVNHPILLERPIVCYDGQAAIGRPPEAVLSLFQGQTGATS